MGGLALFAMLLATALTLVCPFHLAATARKQAIVANGVVGRIVGIERLVVPDVVEDEAVRHLDDRFDAGWARQNIATEFHQTDGFDARS